MARPMINYAINTQLLQRFREVMNEPQAGGKNNIAADLANLTWLWRVPVDGKRIHDILKENELLVWEEGQRSWHPLSPVTVAMKARRRLNPLTMVATQRLHTAATTPGHADNVAYGTKDNYYYGINRERFMQGGWSYPEVHQNIGVGKRRIKRPMVFLRPKTRKALSAFFGRGIRDKMRMKVRGAGLKATVS